MEAALRVLLFPLDLESPSQVPSTAASADDPEKEVSTPVLATSGPYAATTATELLVGMHYTAASYLCELERGHVLSRSTPRELRHASASSLGCVHGHDGTRHYYVCPVEEGRYAAAVSVPPSVHDLLGGCVVPLVIRTAVRGYDISAATASNAAIPTYFPLHRRLRESAAAVQQALQSRVGQIAAAVAAAKTPVAAGNAATVAALRRLGAVATAPSRLRQDDDVGLHLHHLIRAATQPTHPASPTGSFGSVGVRAPTKRFVVAAAAAWFHGEPVYLRARHERVAEQQLLPAAVAVTLDTLLLSPGDGLQPAAPPSGVRKVPVCFKCIAMHAPEAGAGDGANIAWRGAQQGGLMAPCRLPEEQQQRAASALAVGLSNGEHGWTLSLLLEATPTPFAGAPLSFILSGVQSILARQLVSPALTTRLHHQREFSGVEMGLAAAAVVEVSVVVRSTSAPRGFAHFAAETALSASADHRVWYWRQERHHHGSGDGEGTAGHSGPLLDPVLALAARLQTPYAQRRRRRRQRNGDPALRFSDTVCSIIQPHGGGADMGHGAAPPTAVILVQAAPRSQRVGGGIAYVVMNVAPEHHSKKSAADGSELVAGSNAIAFSMWALSKVVQ